VFQTKFAEKVKSSILESEVFQTKVAEKVKTNILE
jgi:hypothetical protein